MKKAYLYCDPRSLNNATNFYIETILSCLKNIGYESETVHEISKIKKADLIFTVTERYYLVSKLSHPLVPHIYWAQGVGPEETSFIPRKLIRTISEFSVAKTSDCLIAVSDALVDHFKSKYGFRGDRYIVMPCFNIQEPISLFDIAQYSSPSFVYAGGATSWQCVDETLDTFKIIENNLSNASLCILSNEKDIFLDKINARGIKNFSIKYVKQSDLAKELSKYKYGFLLRHDTVVNNVATPTKLNGYLASHLIPIMTDSIKDFNSKIQLEEFKIKVPCPFTPKTVANAILDFEKTPKDFLKYKNIISRIFDDYYNLNSYKYKIESKLKQILIHNS